jgi:hypothetical protein
MAVPSRISKVRVSSTCTIWESAASFRVRTQYVPPWITLPFFAVAGSLAAIFSKEPKSGPAVFMDLLVLIDLFAMLFAFNFAACPGSFRIWNSVAGFRFRIRKLPPGNVVEIAASSVWAMSNTMHSMQFRRGGEKLKDLIPFWNESDVRVCAQALSEWLNERRPANTEPIVFTQLVRGVDKSRRVE